MEQPIARIAADAYQNGDYLLALQLYRQAGCRLGEKIFRANVTLCLKRLRGLQLRKDYSATPLTKIRVASVMDEFSYASYKDTCTLHQLSFDHWEHELNEFLPDILFIESAWRGKNDAWTRKISQASPELLGTLEWCKQRNIVTMFWNKEDPIHYGTFLNTAKRFDHVFTTDLNCIGNYKRDLDHENVYLLPFACNPVEHHPVEKYQRKPKACFAGSYYVRYPERIRDLDVLLETLIEHNGVDIYDRNFGKEDVNYAFPEKYAPLILGNLKYDQIDLAYKGYEYGINLNSVKYSPTMFARRVYELLASNTLVVSNYSKGVRLQFGDLAISSDDKTELGSRIEQLSAGSLYGQKIKLAGLRKVMSEHTYEDRFAYITEKILARPNRTALPVINVLAVAKTLIDLHKIIATFRRQRYEEKKLHVLLDSQEISELSDLHANENLIKKGSATNDWTTCPEDEYAAFIDAACYYGDHYLSDLALATRYSKSEVVAKGTVNQVLQHDSVEAKVIGKEYTYGNAFYYHASLISGRLATDLIVNLGTNHGDDESLNTAPDGGVFFIDRFNFVKGDPQQPAFDQRLVLEYSDLPGLDTGVRMKDLLSCAESITPAAQLTVNGAAQSMLFGSGLHGLLNVASAKQRGILCSVHNRELKLDVSKNAESPYYIYTNDIHLLEVFWKDRSGRVFLETTPGLELSPVVVFFDERKNRLNHAILIANWNQLIAIPSTAKFVRLGIRVAGGPGLASVKTWLFDHASQGDRFAWMQSSPLLLIAPNYPAYGAYYRYAFVHRRVKKYKENNLKPDILRFRQGADLEFWEFEDVDVVSGGSDALNTIIQSSNYSTIAIHALDKALWEVVSKHLENRRIVIWLHGAEIQSWKRRMFNCRSPQEVEHARGNGEQRDAMWKAIFALRHPNVHFVFVSDYFCREVLADLSVSAPRGNVHIIHNPIDTRLFRFERKSPEQRMKVLSIRPYASRVYANDLMVEAILELSKRACFEEFEFLVIGDGVLFDDTVSPLRQFRNVEVRKGFLSQREIASLHRQYGVFLCPSRMDTQGVSRDEAMSSGLVPITNRVGAIQEFVDDTTGFVCEAEDSLEIAACLEKLYHSPQLFEAISIAAANNVRETRNAERICNMEIAVILGPFEAR